MKKIIAKLFYFLLGMALFAQSAEYSAYLAKAKEYESQKKWCHALESYYDALGTDDEPEVKQEAYNGFTELRSSIWDGNPGFGKFNAFTLHDEWKNLLIDAEQVGSSFSRYEITLGELKQGNLDYATRTATYTSEIFYKDSDRYLNTVRLVENGYKVAYKEDWSADLPRKWPDYSVSSKKDGTYNVSGALIVPGGWFYGGYRNAFCCYLFDYKFNIVDENGNELVKGVRWRLENEGSRIAFSGISPDIMDLIDNGKAFVNPVACYLEYGKYNYEDDNDGRTFINEVQLPMEKSVFICWNNKTDRKQKNIKKYDLYLIGKELDNLSITFANIPEKNYKVLTTEVTQELYKIVMRENPSYYKGDDLPVENVSWYDAIYFCNKLSLSKNLEPFYSVNGKTDVTDWNYTPHQGNSISGGITQNIDASGYRLPTLEEWLYAASGGEDYIYAGSDDLDEVGWYSGNSDDKTHPVAQKKPNGYGLYDMSGNVWEWVWDSYDYDFDYRYRCGGSYINIDYDGHFCEVGFRNFSNAYYRDDYIGFRLVCPSK